MRVAIVHDWLTGMRGGERCLAAFLAVYPNADIVTLVHKPGSTMDAIDRRVTQTSFLQKIPGIEKHYRYFLPLYPLAAARLDLRGYDLVISLSHAAAKNVSLLTPGTPHICYCFTPMRYIWDQTHQYFGSAAKVMWPLLTAMRSWDRKGARNVSKFVAISEFVAARIRCFYGRRADVIFPPVDLSWIPDPSPQFRQGEAFLCAGALVPYKRIDAAVHAFNELGLPLWIAGSGPEEDRLRCIAGKNIHFFGRVSDVELADIYRHCRAMIFPGIEDFGMMPIECQAAGRPIIGVGEGGLRETVTGVKSWNHSGSSLELGDYAVGEATGVFIQSGKDLVRNIAAGVRYFIEHESDFSPTLCRASAERFNLQRFFNEWHDIISQSSDSMNENKIREGTSQAVNA